MEAAAIRKAHRGATFVRADLHIHTFGEGGSYDVQDASMTPEGVVRTAIQKNLHVIAITDHNSTGNVRRAIAAAQGARLLVVPAVELSSPGGHFLVYAQGAEDVERIVARLDFSEDCHHRPGWAHFPPESPGPRGPS